MTIYIVISALILITCILLTLVVLVQNSKGGGLASNFSQGNQYMGVRKTADFLEKMTWTLAVVLIVLALSSTFFIPHNIGSKGQAVPEVQSGMPMNTMQQPLPTGTKQAPANDAQSAPAQQTPPAEEKK